MGRKTLGAGALSEFENTVNLAAVTTATNGSKIDTRWYTFVSVFVEVTVNTTAVTVNIEASHDGTNWFNLDSKTYTASVEDDIFSYHVYFPFIRTTTTTQSDSTVTITVTGRS